MEEILNKLENVEILMAASIRSSTTMFEKLNSIEADISTISKKTENTPMEVDFGPIMAKIEELRQEKRQETTTKIAYLNLTQPFWWIAGSVVVAVVFGVISWNLYQENQRLEANDIKYRFINNFPGLTMEVQGKKKDFNEISDFKNFNQLIYVTDRYFDKYPEDVEVYVNKREKEIQQAIEKEIRAKEAEQEAKKLKKEADSLKNSR